MAVNTTYITLAHTKCKGIYFFSFLFAQSFETNFNSIVAAQHGAVGFPQSMVWKTIPLSKLTNTMRIAGGKNAESYYEYNWRIKPCRLLTKY